MKLNKLNPLILAAAAVLAGHAQAAIVINDAILIDFGKDTELTTGNWNNISRNQPTNPLFTSAGNPTVVLDADLNRFSDNLGTGVGLSVTSPTGTTPGDNQNVGIGGLTATAGSISFTSSGAIPSSAQTDVVYIQDDSVSFTFTGLDNSLTYNIELLSRVNAGTHDRNTTDVTIGGSTLTIDPNDGLVHAFNNLSSTGGNLTITFSGTGGSAELFHINALQLTAIPEPSSALLGGLGLLALLRRRRA